MTRVELGGIEAEELERALRAVEPRVVLVPLRILRRVIKHDRKMTSPGLQVPHRKSYVLDAAAAAEIVDPDELGPDALAEPAGDLILLARPEPEALADRTPAEVLLRYWRLLFHARIDLAIERRYRDGSLGPPEVRRRVHQIGQTEFDEARSVLRHEDYLLPPRDRMMVYREFAAVYLELSYFAPALLPLYFPSLEDREAIDAILAQDVDAARIFAETRPAGAQAPRAEPEAPAEGEPPLAGFGRGADPAYQEVPGPDAPSERQHRALIRRADRAHKRGNVVRAAILRARADRHRARPDVEKADAPLRVTERSSNVGRGELSRLADRLRDALELDEAEADEWREALPPLLGPATRWGWPVEARLLFDLQKVCIDHERPIYIVDLVEWGLSLGRRPIKRLLPHQQEVLACKHLRTAARRLRSARIPEADRERLARLLGAAVHRAERLLRDRCRPAIAGVLRQVDLRPRNVPESVGFAKLVEELLDRVVDQGYLTMGDLRDALARNQVKLPDLDGPGEFFAGDRLLRANRRLAVALDGVYHRGEAYMRWLQRFSSLGFGTRLGRFLTLYIVMPFGGAFVILKGVDHLAHLLGRLGGVFSAEEEAGPEPASTPKVVAEVAAVEPGAALAEAGRGSTTEEIGKVLSEPGEAVASAITKSGPDPEAQAAGQGDTGAGAEGEAGAEIAGEGEAEPEVDRATAMVGAEDEPGAQAEAGFAPYDGRIADHELTSTEAAAAAGAHHEPALFSHEAFPFVLLVTGILLMGLIHAPRFRRLVGRVLHAAYRLVRGVLVGFPSWFLGLHYVRRVMESRAFVAFWRAFVKPVLPAFLTWAGLRLAGLHADEAFVGALAVFGAVGVFLTLRIGRNVEEIATDQVERTWRLIRVNILIGLFQLVMDFFNRLLEVVDRLLYTVDEWLRFRGGEGQIAYVAKAILGVVWFYATYLIRFVVNLLVEPQINPIKHFPVVTVSHKVMAPILWALFIGAPGAPSTLNQTLGAKDAYTLFTITQLLLPGVFGFLVWELKENWRLYQANRPETLRPARIGHHGETMLRLLRPGLHSGTLPKLFGRLRKAERSAGDSGDRKAVRKYRVALHHVDEAVRHFVDRELLALLREAHALGALDFEVGRIETGINRIRIEVRAPGLPGGPLVLDFEEQSGWLVAGVAEPGWLHALDEAGRRELGAALAGLYKLAGVDLSRQQVEARLGRPAPPHDIDAEGLVVWPGDGFRTEVVYDLQTGRAHSLRPGPGHASVPVDLGVRLLLGDIPIPWARWVETWERDRAGDPPPRPYLEDVRLLPPAPEPVVG